jgi:hypothetical protein
MTRVPEGLVLLRNASDRDPEQTYDIKRGP